jgi:hypothetical protein
MTYDILLVAHIAVLGYWLGSELVINSEYRFICFRDDLPFSARDAMTDHLMDVDQHVRYALIMQLVLGTMLAAIPGFVPEVAFWIAPIAGVAWIALVELVHRQRKTALGQRLATFDRGMRYLALIALIASAIGVPPTLPFWLRLKLAAFAGVIACGIAIRLLLIRHFRLWGQMAAEGPTPEGNARVKIIYKQATSVLGLLWLCIAAATCFAIAKP